MIEKPITLETTFPINEDLSVHYTTFRDGFVFPRPAGAWPRWRKLPFEVPASNPWIYQSFLDGAQFDCCEHVSVAIAGDATYTFMTPDGPKDYLWERGVHNVCNGMGYLPSDTFTRTFHNSFTLCCIVQPFRGRSTTARYSFEVLTGPKTLDRDALAVHYCDTKQTLMGADTGFHLAITVGEIAIVVYQEI